MFENHNYHYIIKVTKKQYNIRAYNVHITKTTKSFYAYEHT